MANLFEVKKVSIDGAEVSFSDLNLLLKARSDAAFQKFIQKFSPDERTLFNLRGEGVSLEYETTINDCKSMQALVKEGMWLSRFMKDPMLIYEDMDLLNTVNATIERDVNNRNKQDGKMLSIPLSGGIEAGRFLSAGLGKAPLNLPALNLNQSSNEPESLLLLCYAVTEKPVNVIISLFDGLSKIMLHDLSATIRTNKIVVASRSLASSLWLTFLETLRTGEIINCIECGTPAFALPKRRNQRKFCSTNCRQKHYRKKKANG